MENSNNSKTHGVRIVAYWIVTLLVAFEMVASFIWVLVGTNYVAANLRHLGYPMYLQNIIGIWDFPGAVTLLVPNFRRLKEWAYAGAFFKYSGAVASHVFAGDGPGRWAVSLGFAILTIASWTLRPSLVGSVQTNVDSEKRTLAWVIPILIITVLVIISIFTVPN
jgi:DoxX-like family